MGKRYSNILPRQNNRNRTEKKICIFAIGFFKLMMIFMCYLHFDPIAERTDSILKFVIGILCADTIVAMITGGNIISGAFSFAELLLFQSSIYISPSMIYYEPAFAAATILEMCLFFPYKVSLFCIPIIGLVWCPIVSASFMSPEQYQGYIAPYHLQMAVCVFFSLVTTVLIHRIRESNDIRRHEQQMNHNLDAINRSLTSQMFSLKSESEQRSKHEITKYVHDNVGYVFTNLIMMLQATSAVNKTNPIRGQEMLENCVNYSHKGLNEIREFLHGIQQEGLGSINIHNEIISLTKLFEKSTGTSVSVEFENWPNSFTPKINSFLLSFVKEAMTNAIKHGAASKIAIHCGGSNRFRINMNISNNGILPEGNIIYGMGLKSISDDLLQLGGSLKVTCAESMFILSVSIPYVRISAEKSKEKV